MTYINADALRLRARGYTYQQIADALGYPSRDVAVNEVWRSLGSTPPPPRTRRHLHAVPTE